MNDKGPAPPVATHCGDCKKRFGKDATQWDVHVGGGQYITVCTPCFEKRDKSRPSSKK